VTRTVTITVTTTVTPTPSGANLPQDAAYSPIGYWGTTGLVFVYLSLASFFTYPIVRFVKRRWHNWI
ncbi:MAG: hypothetical protein QXE25_05630, partial [Nitrososphaerota archaeon]